MQYYVLDSKELFYPIAQKCVRWRCASLVAYSARSLGFAVIFPRYGLCSTAALTFDIHTMHSPCKGI